jgi:hypothetical protein
MDCRNERLTRRLLLLLLLLPLMLCFPVAVAQKKQNRPVAVVPFELSGNLIFLQVRVNNKAPLWFILDTGAGVSILKEKQAQSLGLKLETREQVLDGMPHAKGIRLGLTGTELLDQTIFVAPTESLEPSVGRAVDGILGFDLFQRFVVEIDYAARRLRLFETADYLYQGAGESIPLIIEDNTPFVRATITQPLSNSAEGQFLIDTGASGALNVFKRFDEPHGFSSSLSKMLQSTGVGFSGKAQTRTGRIRALQLGRLRMTNVVAGFSQADDSSDEAGDGEIGGELLRRFKVIVDYARKRIVLESGARFAAEPYEASLTGASIASEGADFKTFKVRSVFDNSPAAEAGLRAGDIITAINGRPAAQLTAEQLRQMFRLKGRRYILKIKRGEAMLQITLRTRRLI